MAAVLLALAAGCGDDGTTDPADVPADQQGPVDVPDALPDVPQDAPTDVARDAEPDAGSSDVVPDAAPDVPSADVAPDAQGEDATDDVAADVPPAPELDPIVAASLSAILAEHITFSADRGLSMTVRDAQGAWWSGAEGFAVTQDGTAMKPDTAFRVGSNTKPFTAALVLQLIDEGKVALDDDITKYVPDYPQWEGITIRHLLSMRSGIIDYLRDPALMLEAVTTPEKVWTPKQILDFVADDDLAFVPGEAGLYTNSNYLLLGLVIEKVTGRSADQELQDRLLTPLGLDDTFLDLTGAESADLAHGYMDLSLVGILFGVPASVIDFIPTENVVEGTIIDTTYLFHPSLTWMAGALVSTTQDMGVFMHALMTGELVSPALLEEAKEALEISLMNKPVPYGLGLQIRPSPYGTLYGHGGLNFGYQAGTYYVPDSGVTVSHMHNFLPEQSDGLQNEVLSVLTQPPTVAPVPCLEPEGFFAATALNGLFQGRFKGPVNDFGQVPRATGIGVFTQQQGEDRRPLYGIGVSSILKAPAGGKARLDIESLSPTGDEGATYRLASISIERDLLASGLDANGAFTAAGATAGRAYVMITDIWTDPATAAPNKMCFRTLTDFAKGTRLQVCQPDSFEPDAGATLRIFVEGQLLTDPTAIAQTLTALKLPACMCPNETGVWGACPVAP